MSTRLLSFLTDIEQALFKESISNMGPVWDVTRMVNYHHGLARLTLVPQADADPAQPRGAVFLQSFTLSDGSICLKASLNWHGSESFPILSVYSKPQTNWKQEAARIASAWLAGPVTTTLTALSDEHELSPLVAVAG